MKRGITSSSREVSSRDSILFVIIRALQGIEVVVPWKIHSLSLRMDDPFTVLRVSK